VKTLKFSKEKNTCVHPPRGSTTREGFNLYKFTTSGARNVFSVLTFYFLYFLLDVPLKPG